MNIDSQYKEMSKKIDEAQMHPFEKAGLGKPPYRVTGVERRVGPMNVGGLTVGAPGQPMGTCQYCSRGIAICMMIVSSDGVESVVGSECVKKVNDNALRKQANPVLTKFKNAEIDQRIKKAVEKIQDPEVLEYLENSPNPMFEDSTLLSWVEWMLKASGRTGKLKVAKVIEGIVKEIKSYETQLD